VGRAFVVTPGTAPHLDLGTFGADVLATAEQTDHQFSLLETVGEPPGFGPPLHVHHDAAEAFVVLEGDYVMYVDGHRHECPRGTFVYVPAGTPHTFTVAGDRAGRKLNLFTPAAMVGYFEALAVAEADGRIDDRLLGEIAERHHMEVLGPVPEGYL
jgi:mannose-6-phosphate isomerase-like protein (cupin superfamily)